MNRIFINYRREDALVYADRLQEVLSEHFGPDEVFRDVDTIEMGLDFVDAIDRALTQADVMLVLIGRHWLVSPDGRTRLHDSEDFVRLEVAGGLQRPNVRVIPVLVGGATMPTSEDLPADLSSLTRRHAFEMTDDRFRFDRDELVRRLSRVLGTERADQPPPQAPEPEPEPAAPPPAPAPPAEQPRDPTRTYVIWGWVLNAGSLIFPLLAIGGIVFGVLTIKRSGGRRTGMGIALIVAAIVIGLFSFLFWLGAASQA